MKLTISVSLIWEGHIVPLTPIKGFTQLGDGKKGENVPSGVPSFINGIRMEGKQVLKLIVPSAFYLWRNFFQQTKEATFHRVEE